LTFQRCLAIYDLASGQPLCEPLAHIDAYSKGALSFIQDRFATRNAEGLTVLWGVKTNRAQAVAVRHTDSVMTAHFSPDGQRVVTGSYDGTAQVWDARTGQRIGPPLTHAKKVWSACFSPDGRRVATASWDNSARIWDASSGAPLSPPLPAGSYVFHVEFSPDGERLLTCGEDGVTRLYEGHTGKPVCSLPHENPTYWAQFSPDGRTVVTRPSHSNPILWDAQTGGMLCELQEPSGRQAKQGFIVRGDFSRNGSWLALGSPETYATLWHLPEGRLHAVLNQGAMVRAAVFSPDARTLLTTADDLTVQLWDVQTGKARTPPQVTPRRPGARLETGQALRAAAMHPDGRRFVTGGSDGAARLWDLRNGLPLGEPAEFDGEVKAAEFSPDGQRLLVACFDGTAHILPLPPVIDRAPAWLVPLAEALVGQRFDEHGATFIVSPTALWEACEAIRHAPKDDPAVRWARDLLDL
jgi:WD40 repeat protein